MIPELTDGFYYQTSSQGQTLRRTHWHGSQPGLGPGPGTAIPQKAAEIRRRARTHHATSLGISLEHQKAEEREAQAHYKICIWTAASTVPGKWHRWHGRDEEELDDEDAERENADDHGDSDDALDASCFVVLQGEIETRRVSAGGRMRGKGRHT
eukprot:750866-Hanusia_phi.AAC.6